jgi:putative glutamine amidotransferase
VQSLSRPLIAIPARFSQSASALRFRAEVNAHKLIEAIYAAGGEPLTIHPSDAVGLADIAARLDFVDAVVLPGGGDISPALYGGDHHDELYDVDQLQDAFDVAVATWTMRTARPLLAICRGLQVVNIACGGTLFAHLDRPHRHVTSRLAFGADTHLAAVTDSRAMTISCFHHQAIDRLGEGLHAAAWSDDGVVEAVETADDRQWFVGVQWHPEDTAETDPAQQAIFTGLVRSASDFARAQTADQLSRPAAIDARRASPAVSK